MRDQLCEDRVGSGQRKDEGNWETVVEITNVEGVICLANDQPFAAREGPGVVIPDLE